MKPTLLEAMFNFKIWIAAAALQVNPVSEFISTYVFSDIGFLKWLAIAMMVDLITGIAKVIKNDGIVAVTSSGLRGTIVKFLQYGAFIIITHVLVSFEVGGQKTMTDFPWLSKMAYEFIMLIEIKSVYENIVAIDSRFDFFPKLIKKALDNLPNKYKQNDNETKS